VISIVAFVLTIERSQFLTAVDLDYFRPSNNGSRPWTALAPENESHCVFVGALDYHANIDGICWFATCVWPLIRRELPQLTLALVGRNPSSKVKKLESLAGVRVFGAVPDVRPYLASARIAIAPLRIARGIQNKVLEAMAMATPVVASPAALEGLDVEIGSDAMSALTPAQWRDAIVCLHNDDALCKIMGSRGRAFVEGHHSWAAQLQPYATLLSNGTRAVAPEGLLVAGEGCESEPSFGATP